LDALGGLDRPADETTELLRLEKRLPPLLSVIAGMVDLIGFFTLGSFTAHVTGNLVVAAAAAVRGGPWNLAQALAIPVFMAAVAGAQVADYPCFQPTRCSSDTAASCDAIFITARGVGFQCRYGALDKSAWLDGRYRSHDRGLRNGVSVRSHALGIAKGGFNGGDDR